MTRLTSRALVVPAGAALALTLTACGADDGGSSGPAEERLGPLDTYFEQIYGQTTEDQGAAQMMQVEELVAECMREQGFEYTPVDYSSQSGQMFTPEDLDVEWGSKEFAEQYGYGITTDPYGDPAAEPMPEGEPQEWVDPNQAYVEAMSETELQAYQEALYGAMAVGPEEGMEEEWEYDWTQAGCQGRAQHEVYETVPGVDEEQMKSLQAEMEAMWETSMSDPRIQEVESAWADCMADAGYTGLAAVGDAENQLSEELNAVYEEFYGEQSMDEDMTEEDFLAIEEQIQERRSALTSREIETAVADFGCRDEVGYTEVMQDVTFEHQQAFVDAHRAELDAWAAAAEATRQ